LNTWESDGADKEKARIKALLRWGGIAGGIAIGSFGGGFLVTLVIVLAAIFVPMFVKSTFKRTWCIVEVTTLAHEEVNVEFAKDGGWARRVEAAVGVALGSSRAWGTAWSRRPLVNSIC
jgi:hypothetical protein